jgi:hypothetical protein
MKQVNTSSPYSAPVSRAKRSGEDRFPHKRMRAHLPDALALQYPHLKRKHQRSGAAGTTPFGTSSRVFAEQRASKKCFIAMETTFSPNECARWHKMLSLSKDHHFDTSVIFPLTSSLTSKLRASSFELKSNSSSNTSVDQTFVSSSDIDFGCT